MIRRPVMHNPSSVAQCTGQRARVVVTVQSNVPLDFSDENGRRMLALNAAVAARGYETALAFRPDLCLITPSGVSAYPDSDMLLRVPQADYDEGVRRMGGVEPLLDARWDAGWFLPRDRMLADSRVATYGRAGNPAPVRAHALLDLRLPRVWDFVARHALRLLEQGSFRWLCLGLKPDMYGPERTRIVPGATSPGMWHALPYVDGDYLRGVGKIIELLHAHGVEMCASSSNPSGAPDPLAALHPNPKAMLAFLAG